MINTRLIYMDPKSFSKISTVMILIGSIIMLIISAIAITLLVNALPRLQDIIFNNYTVMVIVGIIIGLIITLVLNYILTYINALLYNYLLKYFKGIQFELTPYNEIKEIDIVPTLIINIVIISIFMVIIGIILVLTFSIVMSILTKITPLFGNIDLTTIAASSVTAVTLAVLFSIIMIAILEFINLFLLNFFSRRNPLKLNIVEDNGLEIKSIDVISYVMSIGLTLLTIQLIRTLINIMVGGSMEVALLNIINTISICLVISVAIPYIYNLVSSKIGGLKFDIEPSSNMIQAYEITDNNYKNE